VELKSDRVSTERKRLIWTRRRRGEAFGAGWELEEVAMPVQDGQSIQVAQRSVAAGFGQFDRRPADFLNAGGDARAEGNGHELGAQANAERRRAGCESGAQRLDLRIQKGVEVALIGADRAAEDNQQISRLGLDRPQFVDAGVEVANAVAGNLQRACKGAEVLEVHMPDCQSGSQFTSPDRGSHDHGSAGGIFSPWKPRPSIA
jgi:hypothetical protein